jgi:death on curing protein
MMRYPTLAEILDLHERLLSTSGGARGVRDLAMLESSVAQPRATFDQQDLYPDIISKSAALCHGLILNHPFVDGNKRTGHAAMELFLILNGLQLSADVSDQERVILDLAAGKMSRHDFTAWVRQHATSDST